jgi:hypothetical protein
VILQVLCEAGRAREQVAEDYQRREGSIKGLAQDRGWSFCSSLSIIHKGKTKVAFLCLFLRQLSHLSGIEQFYIDTFPCNKMATPLSSSVMSLTGPSGLFCLLLVGWLVVRLFM